MNLLADEWSIQHRSEVCAVTGRSFGEGENFYTLLFRDGEGFRRQDLSEEAWQQRNENLQPFSFWRARFEAPAPEPPEPLAKETAEDLFRRLVAAADGASWSGDLGRLALRGPRGLVLRSGHLPAGPSGAHPAGAAGLLSLVQ